MRIGNELRNLDRHAIGRKSFQVVRTRPQFENGSAVIAAEQMVTSHTDLQDTLVQHTNGAWFVIPDALKRLVTLEILAVIELLDSMQQPRRRSIGAAGRNSTRGGAIELGL
jgi:hypothetical protein